MYKPIKDIVSMLFSLVIAGIALIASHRLLIASTFKGYTPLFDLDFVNYVIFLLIMWLMIRNIKKAKYHFDMLCKEEW